jgi:hypothetical protein
LITQIGRRRLAGEDDGRDGERRMGRRWWGTKRLGEEHDWLGFGPRAAVLPDLVVVRGNTQFTPAGGDLFPDLMASLTERN